MDGGIVTTIKIVVVALLKIGAMGLAVLLLFPVSCAIMDYRKIHAENFNSDWWKAYSSASDDTKRCAMVGDLKGNYLQKGMTKEQIQKLLGPEQPLEDYDNPNQDCMNYWVGYCSSYLFDSSPYSFDLCFNPQGKLIETRIENR